MPDTTTTIALPHFQNSTASRSNYEPVFLNQYEVLFTPPVNLNFGDNSVQLMTEQVKNVKGLPEITPVGKVEQFYKFSKRTFAEAKPKDTTAEITIEFEVNLTHELDMYVYNFFRAWADMIYDPETGSMGLKHDYVGEMQIIITNKARQLFRNFKFKPVYLLDPFNKMDLDYITSNLYRMTVKFQADDWDEERTASGKYYHPDTKVVTGPR